MKREQGYFKKLAAESGLKYQTIYQRINTYGWDEKLAISTPLTSPRSYKKILKKNEAR